MKKRTSNTDDVPLKSLLFACLSTRQDLGLVIFVFGHPPSLPLSCHLLQERERWDFLPYCLFCCQFPRRKLTGVILIQLQPLSTSSLCPYPPFISKRLLTPLLRRFGWQNIIKMQIGSSFSAPVLFSQIPSNSVGRFVGRIWQKRFRQ